MRAFRLFAATVAVVGMTVAGPGARPAAAETGDVLLATFVVTGTYNGAFDAPTSNVAFTGTAVGGAAGDADEDGIPDTFALGTWTITGSGQETSVLFGEVRNGSGSFTMSGTPIVGPGGGATCQLRWTRAASVIVMHVNCNVGIPGYPDKICSTSVAQGWRNITAASAPFTMAGQLLGDTPCLF